MRTCLIFTFLLVLYQTLHASTVIDKSYFGKVVAVGENSLEVILLGVREGINLNGTQGISKKERGNKRILKVKPKGIKIGEIVQIHHKFIGDERGVRENSWRVVRKILIGSMKPISYVLTINDKKLQLNHSEFKKDSIKAFIKKEMESSKYNQLVVGYEEVFLFNLFEKMSFTQDSIVLIKENKGEYTVKMSDYADSQIYKNLNEAKVKMSERVLDFFMKHQKQKLATVLEKGK